MKVEEESAQLLEELRQLRSQVADLTARVRSLEAEGQADAPPPAEGKEEREGDFGPAVKRSTSSQHQSAVSKALTMLGVLPVQSEARKSKEADASHARALAKMRQLGGGGAEPETVVAKPIAEVVEAAKPQPAEPPSSDIRGIAESIAHGAGDEIIPLPELRDDTGPKVEPEHEASPVALDTAIPIDLERPPSRVPDLLRLLLETGVLSALLLALPAHQGVLAAVGFIALIAMPRRHVLRAHARFLSLVVLVRCLVPDVWSQASPLQLPAMLAACLPAFAVVFVGRVGWAVQAIGLGAVAGAIALAQDAGHLYAIGIGAVIFGLALLWRRVRM